MTEAPIIPATKLVTSPLLTVEDAARRLRMSPRTIRRRIKDGALEVVRFERTIRITEASLQAFINRHSS